MYTIKVIAKLLGARTSGPQIPEKCGQKPASPAKPKVFAITAIILFFSTMVVPVIASEPLKLLIFPMSGYSGSVGAWAGEGIALSLAGQLTDDEIQPFSRGETEDLLIENGLPTDARLSSGSMIFVAEQAKADYVVIGSFTENDGGLKLSVRLLDIKAMKQRSEFTVSGMLETLPVMENELAWMIYSSVVQTPALSREQFRERARRVPNTAYAGYIESLNVFSESRQMQLLEKAIKEYADFAEARFRIGRLYYQKRDYARALPHVEYGRKLPNERLQSDFMIGTCRLQLGETAQAIEEYTRIISRTRHIASLNNLAIAHVRNGDISLALRALTDAVEQDPEDPSIVINLAIAQYISGDAPEAVKSVEAAVSVYPGNGMLHFMSSFLMNDAGNADRASAYMAQATRFGVDAYRLLREDPKVWMRVILDWEE